MATALTATRIGSRRILHLDNAALAILEKIWANIDSSSINSSSSPRRSPRLALRAWILKNPEAVTTWLNNDRRKSDSSVGNSSPPRRSTRLALKAQTSNKPEVDTTRWPKPNKKKPEVDTTGWPKPNKRKIVPASTDFPSRWRMMTAAEKKMYDKVTRESEGFDAPDMTVLSPGQILPVLDLERRMSDLKFCCGLAIEKYFKEKGKRIQFVRVVKATMRACAPINYFITFEARDEDGNVDVYQARVFMRIVKSESLAGLVRLESESKSRKRKSSVEESSPRRRLRTANS